MLEMSFFVAWMPQGFQFHGEDVTFSHVAKELEELLSARWNRPFSRQLISHEKKKSVSIKRAADCFVLN